MVIRRGYRGRSGSPVYPSFAATGRAPDLDQLSTRCGLSAAETGDALRRWEP
jgi:hypothetical protein